MNLRARPGTGRIPTILIAIWLSCICPSSYAGAVETGADRITTLNPRYDLKRIRPSNFEPRVTGMAFRADGKLVLSTVNTLFGADWAAGMGADAKSLYLLSGIDGPDPEKIIVKKIAGPDGAAKLVDPQGIVILDGAYYVSDKDKLLKLEDSNGDDVIDVRTEVAHWKWGKSNHEFAFGPAYKDGYFYLTTSVQLAGPGPSAKVQNVDERGTCLKVSRADGSVEVIAGGLRTPNGIGFGPRGEIFVTDNQGSYLPSSKLINIRKGRTYGHLIDSPVPVFQNQPVSPPVVWMPQDEIGQSPSQPVLLTMGPYAGQMAFGDVAQGGVKRVNLEEVNGEFQGAIMPLSGGLEGGMDRILLGADGSLYLGGIGKGDQENWGWKGTLFGLQRLQPNGKSLFEILAVHSRKDGMELEFTEPIATDFDATKLEVWQWWYQPTYDYGGPRKDRVRLTVKTTRVSTDGKSLFMQVDGLKTGQVTNIKAYGIKSKAGQEPYFYETWYTLNAISPSSAFEVTASGGERRSLARIPGFRVRGPSGGSLRIDLPGDAESLELRDMRGTCLASRGVKGITTVDWELRLPGRGVYIAALRRAGQAGWNTEAFALP